MCNAKKSNFEGIFGAREEYRGQLYTFIKAGVSDVTFIMLGMEHLIYRQRAHICSGWL